MSTVKRCSSIEFGFLREAALQDLPDRALYRLVSRLSKLASGNRALIEVHKYSKGALCDHGTMALRWPRS